MNPLPPPPSGGSNTTTTIVVGGTGGSTVPFHEHPASAITSGTLDDDRMPERIQPVTPLSADVDQEIEAGWWAANIFSSNTPASSSWVGQTIRFPVVALGTFSVQTIYEVVSPYRIYQRTLNIFYTAWQQIDRTFYDTRYAPISVGISTAPTATASTGTASSGTTETRDAVLGDYVFTALAGRRYQVFYNGLIMSASVAADVYQVRIRNGGASTPTAASTLIAATQWVADTSGGPGQQTVPVSKTFVPGAGTVTLSAFTVRTAGTGVGTPTGDRELFVVDVGPS